MERESHANVQQRHRQLFPEWFRQRITSLYYQEPRLVSEEIFSLAQGPDQRTVQYTGCIVNGIRYLVRHVDQNRTTQNSGVMTPGSHNGEPCNFYGILVNVIKVQFTRGFKVILFKCHWYNTDTRGKKVIRDYHLTSLNVNNHWYDGDPYVLAKQAHQVFYIDDLKLGHPWKVVQKIQHRHIWDVPEKDDDDDDEEEEDNATDEDDDEYVDENENSTRRVHNDDEVDISLCRDDVDPESFDINNKEVRIMLGLQRDEDEEEEKDDEEEEEDEDEDDEEDN